MPGDRVHNFFAQDNSTHGQHRSHVGNQSMLNNNFWLGSQRQIDVPNSSSINYSSQNSETDTLQASYPVNATHSFNFSQSNLRPDFSKSGSINEHQPSNGFMYGNQFHRTRQNEANFLAVDTDSDQRHLIASRSQPVHELQQPGGEERQTKTSDRPDTSGPPVGFDLFGGQQQTSHQQVSMLQALQCRQSGLNDMQQFQQQQLMIRKMQELQRQQQLWQLDSMPQHLINQVPPFSKETSSSQSPTLVNGTPNSEALQYPWTADPGKNWLSRSSSALQGSSGGHVFSADVGRTQHLVDVVPQHVDQSLYGVPVSSSRGLVNQYSQMVTERSSSMAQMANSSNSSLPIQHNFLPDQIGGHEETSISRQKFQNLNIGHVSSQSLSTGIVDNGGLQQVNFMQRSAPQHEFPGRQEQAAQSETSYEISTRQVSEPGNEVALEPAEEKILYGSDDNIWSAFGKSTNMTGETANLFDNGGSPDGFLQSGSWSALMQSAVAETSSSDIRAREEWSGLNFHNPEGSSANQAHSMHNDNVKQASMPSENIHISSALISGSNPPSSNVNTLNVMGSNQLGYKFQNEPCQRTPTDTSQRFGQSLEEAREWSNRIPLQKSVAEAIQLYGNASEQSLNAERKPKTITTTWSLEQSGIRQPLSGWNEMADVPCGPDRLLNTHVAENLSQNSRNNQVRVMQRDGGHGSSLWKSNSVTGCATELGPVQSTEGNHQESKGALSLNDATASVANSSNKGVADRTNAFVQNKDLFSQWKNGYPSANVQGAEGLSRMPDQVNEYNNGLNLLNSIKKYEVTRHDMQNCAMKENSNDSHQSNSSQHASGGFRESGLLDLSGSRSLPLGKQRSNDQLASKVPLHRKFQYHPMGNMGEEVEPTNGPKQPTQVQAISMQNTQFGQSKLFGQVPRNSRGTEKDELPKYNKDPEPEPPCGSLPGCVPNMSVPMSRTLDSCINRASSPSQNMLELLHKVDQSRDHDSLMHLSSGRNLSSHLPEAEKFDASAGRLQRSQSSAPQGFGLQLGPPSEKGLVMVPASAEQSLPPKEESLIEFENDRSAGPGHPGNGNSLYKAPGNYHPAFSSGTPYARSQLQNKITRLSGEVATNQHIDSFSCNASHSLPGGSAESVLPDFCHNIQKDNFAPSGGTVQRGDPCDVQEIVRPATSLTRNEMHPSQHFGMPGISREGASGQVLHNMWARVSPHQHTLAAQHPAPPSQFSGPLQPNILESNSQGNLNFGKVSHHSSEVHANSPAVFDGKEPRLKETSGHFASFANTGPVPEMEDSLGKASSIKNHLDDSPANSTSKLKDTEAFRQSLKPNVVTNRKHALPNQMRTWRDSETDPCIRVSKRVRGLDNDLSVRQVHLMAGTPSEDNVGDSRASSTGNPSQDSSLLGFSTPTDILQRNTYPQRKSASQDIVVAGVDASSSNLSTDCTTSVRVEHNLVSPQIAPFGFNHYGSVKDGQMLPMHNARMSTSLRPEDASYTLEKSSSVLVSCNLEEKISSVAIDACEGGRTLINSAAKSESNEVNVADHHQVNLGPKKRKHATGELYSWHNEISEGSQNLSILSVAETDWNKAANSLTEKVEDDADLIEDGSPVLRSNRRLVLTTQLMQQIFQPPPGTILSADACLEYDCATYAVSRVALGDACGAVSRSSDVGLAHEGTDLHSIKGRLNGDPHFAKVEEELLGKARKLESDFLRLDNSASILDLRLEGQDLEKFSIINRFAKYLGGVENDNSETSTTRKPSARRYVYSIPPPRNFPDWSVPRSVEPHDQTAEGLDMMMSSQSDGGCLIF